MSGLFKIGHFRVISKLHLKYVKHLIMKCPKEWPGGKEYAPSMYDSIGYLDGNRSKPMVTNCDHSKWNMFERPGRWRCLASSQRCECHTNYEKSGGATHRCIVGSSNVPPRHPFPLFLLALCPAHTRSVAAHTTSFQRTVCHVVLIYMGYKADATTHYTPVWRHPSVYSKRNQGYLKRFFDQL